MPWILWGPGFLRRGWGVFGLDGDDVQVGVVLAKSASGAGDGAAGAYARDEHIDLAVGVAPDLLARRLIVRLGIRLVRELPGPYGVLGLRHDLLRALDGSSHAFSARRQNYLSPIGAQHDPPLRRHGLGHRQHHAVSPCGAHHGQGDAGVARRAFDDGASRTEVARLLGGVDDGLADAILDGGGRRVELGLQGYVARKVSVESVQSDQGVFPMASVMLFSMLHSLSCRGFFGQPLGPASAEVGDLGVDHELAVAERRAARVEVLVLGLGLIDRSQRLQGGDDRLGVAGLS